MGSTPESVAPWLVRPIETAVSAALGAGRIVFLSGPRFFGKSGLLERCLGTRQVWHTLSLHDPGMLLTELGQVVGTNSARSVQLALEKFARNPQSELRFFHITDGQGLSPYDSGAELAARRYGLLAQMLTAVEDPDVRARVRLVVSSLVPFARMRSENTPYWSLRMGDRQVGDFTAFDTLALASMWTLNVNPTALRAIATEVGGHPFLTTLLFRSVAEGMPLGQALAMASLAEGPLARFFQVAREWFRDPILLRRAKQAVAEGQCASDRLGFALESLGIVRPGPVPVPYGAVANWIQRL